MNKRSSMFSVLGNPSAQRSRRLLAWAVSALLLAGIWVPPTSAAGKVSAGRGQITLPTYPWWPAVKHPYFRGTDRVNIYPYPMLDNLSRTKEPRAYRTVVLENGYLRITFLPELGGKIHEVIDKTTGQPMFYVNNVVKPGLIGQCGAWTSGGVEWNTGPQGHTVGCMQPVHVEILPAAPDGSRSVAIGEVERIYGTRWTVVVTLRPNRAFIEETIRIYNPTTFVRPYYFWNCTAVPNSPGFRFIYPMTLGSDHGATQFFQWPIHEGKDLTRGTNYQDASSIFAWHCDQDFFGSYDDAADRGVVSHANHRQLPGKKAWTWGQGSFGAMHQMDLTDDDGPYNEVQTGPLLTQADLGRLEPHEVVTWQEWWYPVHGIGGFTFANRDLAANAGLENGRLRLRLLGTAQWGRAKVRVSKDQRLVVEASCDLTPRKPADLSLDLAGAAEPLDIEVTAGNEVLARFRSPLDLPVRQPPEKKPEPQSATELAGDGWQEFLFARFPKAEAQFLKALEKDARAADAHAGLAMIQLETNPAKAAAAARLAVAASPDHGLARLILAAAELRLGNEKAAMDEAWKASLDPASAAPARALAALLSVRAGDYESAVQALAEPGPWQADPVCRNRLAFACFKVGDRSRAVALARESLSVDPLDVFARAVLWLARSESSSLKVECLVKGQAQPTLELVDELVQLGQEEIALRVLREFNLEPLAGRDFEPIPAYWAAWLAHRLKDAQQAEKLLALGRRPAAEGVFPHRPATVPVLRWACETQPGDGKARLYLGHLLFAVGRSEEAKGYWEQAVQLGAATPIALRALGLAKLRLDDDPKAAADLLTRASQADASDAIIARDLARVLFQLADQAGDAARKTELIARVRDTLKAALPAGKGRSDFVALLARAHTRLNEHAETAALLDAVRITVWEGAREVHDLFEEAHLVLGEAHLKAGRAAPALAEFERALEYPANLATGKLANKSEAHIHYLRGNALLALDRQADAIRAYRKAASEPEPKDAKAREARQKARAALEALR